MDNTTVYKKLNNYKLATIILSIVLSITLLYTFFNTPTVRRDLPIEVRETLPFTQTGTNTGMGGGRVLGTLDILVSEGEISQIQADLILDTMESQK